MVLSTLLLLLLLVDACTAFKGKPEKGPPQAKIGGVMCCGGKKTEAAPHWQVSTASIQLYYDAHSAASCCSKSCNATERATLAKSVM
jgi:hypothetical protein